MSEQLLQHNVRALCGHKQILGADTRLRAGRRPGGEGAYADCILG